MKKKIIPWNRPSASLSESVKERDGYKCAFQLAGICAGFCSSQLESHHIDAFAYARKHDNLNNPNRASNMVTVCLSAHARIHPLLIATRRRTPEGQEQIKKCIRLNRQGKKYWNDDFDHILRQIAIENDAKMQKLFEKKFD